jgi:hypothetical protein
MVVVATWLCVGLGMFSFLKAEKFAKIQIFSAWNFPFYTVKCKDQGGEI